MKKISLIIFTVLIGFLLLNKVEAASASISISSNKSQVIVGESVTITVKISSSSPLGSWQFDVQGSSNLSFSSSSFGGQTVKDYGNASTYSKTYYFYFKATSSGNAKVSVVNPRAIEFHSVTDMSISGKTVYFNTLTQSELEDSYSKNNDLSNLEIEGYTLTPNFDKDVLEYNLEVENDVTSVNVIASKDDSKSSVKGDGEIPVIEGVNPLDIIVTAQNGSVKTYTINVTVKELEPIDVTVDNIHYTVIRKADFFPSTSIFFEETTIMINDFEVPVAYNLKNDLTLVALKDDYGKIFLFKYENNSYSKYEEIVFNQIHIIPMPFEMEGYESVNVTIGSNAVLGYIKDDMEFPLIYGKNLETGEESIYSYDKVENTLQRYIEREDNLYLYIIIGLTGFIVITYVVIIIKTLSKNSKLKHQLQQLNEVDVTKVKHKVKERENDEIKSIVNNDISEAKHTDIPLINQTFDDDIENFLSETKKIDTMSIKEEIKKAKEDKDNTKKTKKKKK